MHRFDDSYDRNVHDMREALSSSIQEKAPEEDESLLESSMGMLEEAPKIDLDAGRRPSMQFDR